MLPLEVLERAREELLDFKGSGMSVMEISHRSDLYQEVAEHAQARVRRLLGVPSNYHVLFLQGGASAQFAAIPMNLVEPSASVAYVDTGLWSLKAIEEAQRFTAKVIIAASTRDSQYSRVPDASEWVSLEAARYLHFTANETIGGVEFQDVPDAMGLPLVCDMSSSILSRPVDVSSYGLIYAGAQKNLGPSGLTLVVVREDLLEAVPSRAPKVLDYAEQARQGSMLNTPPTYPWYLLGLVLEWLESRGGVEAMEKENERKSSCLYEAIDRSSLFENPVARGSRSRMNIPFRILKDHLAPLFLKAARERGLVNLEGHRSVGGFRASLYNAMPYEGVSRLVECLADFEAQYG